MKFAALFLAGAVLALGAAPAPVTHDFLAAGALDYRTLLAPPPADDSIAGRADREMALMLDADRTPAQAELAKHYATFDIFTLLAPVLGERCNAENLPRTKAVFSQVYAEARPLIEAAKADWNRPRPHVANPSLQPAVGRPTGASYPSGHAYAASLYAVLLGAALPEHAADWEKQARLIRWSRLVGGAHYPSDVIAGQALGEAVGREMLKSPKLREALAEIRAELAKGVEKKAA